MNKVFKILAIVILLIGLLSLNINIYAAGKLDSVVSGADDFLNNGLSQDNPMDPNGQVTGEASDMLYSILFSIGVGVAFIYGIYLGIKFITGTIDDKVQIKKNIIAYLVGCVIIFGAFGIWKLAINLMSQIN